MASFQFLVLVFLPAILLYISVSFYRNHRKLRNFKGPPLASLSSFWLLRQSLNKRSHIAQFEALRDYGSPARIGPNMLITDDPELLRYMSAPKSNFTRGNWYDGMKLDPRVNNVFSERDERRHKELRAKLNNGVSHQTAVVVVPRTDTDIKPQYSGKGVANLESSIAEQVDNMLTLIRRDYVSRNKAVDMARLAQYFTLDVLSQIAFGDAFGYLEANKDLYEYNRTSIEFMPILELITNHPSIRSVLSSRPVQALVAPKGTDKVGQGRIIGIAHAAIAKRYLPNAKPKQDMLGSFIANGLTQQEAEVESLLQIMAGSDSTSTAMRMTFLYVVTSPIVYAKLQAEIDDAIVRGAASEPVIKDIEARELPYLQAVKWEGLRMCPPLFGLQSKMAPPEGETFNGLYFPGGCEIAICPAAVTRRKDVFGEDVNVFRPERWIDADEVTRTKYERTVDCVFGTGRFGCLGKGVAMLELNKVFFEYATMKLRFTR